MHNQMMTQSTKEHPVLVTGATGYVAGWLVKRLLDEGYTVHAAVRDPSNKEKLQYLDAIAEQSSDQSPGNIRYFKTDLLEPGSYAEAMDGCEVVFHTASPFTLEVEDVQKELVDPALLGTRNILEQANECQSVRRVVVTSSTAAICSDAADMQNAKGEKLSEEDWNETSSIDHQPYSYSKVVAEREAWKIAGAQDRWDLVTINPSFVLGPGINPFATSETFTLFKQLGDGTVKTGVPNMAICAVDVRDVADAHMAAAFTESAKGRYIISGHDSSFLELGNILRDQFGDSYPFPRRTLPKFMVWLVGPILNKSLTRKVVSRGVGWPLFCDNSKSVSELGMSYRPLEDSANELFQQLVDNGLIKSKKG